MPDRRSWGQRPLRLAALMPVGLASAVTGLAVPSAVQAAPATAPAGLSGVQRGVLEARISNGLQRLVNRQPRIEGQGQTVVVVARFKTRLDGLVVDLGRVDVPCVFGSELKELLHARQVEATELAGPQIDLKDVRFLFDDRDPYHCFPAERRDAPAPRSLGPAPAAASVVVDAGHRINFHHQYDHWRAQRDPSNGITEDFLTPSLATELSTWPSARSGATSTFPRSTSATVHAPGGQAWWQIAARHHLAEPYPDQRTSGIHCPMPRTPCANAMKTSAAARCWPATLTPTP